MRNITFDFIVKKGNFMNYKNLVFTALMTASFMSHTSEAPKTQSSSWPALSWGSWVLGATTLGLSTKCAYHYIKSNHYLRQQKQLKNERDQIINSHNQKVVNTGREPNPDSNAIRAFLDPILLPDLANIAVEYSRPYNWQEIRTKFIWANQHILYKDDALSYPLQGIERGAQGGNFDLSGSFRLLTAAEKSSLFQDKQSAQEQIQNNTHQRENYTSKIHDHRDNLQVAGGVAIASGMFFLMHTVDVLFSSKFTTRGR